MKFTTHFIKTQKERPSDANSLNAELLQQAGFIHQEMAGVYSFLPLGLAVLEHIQKIIQEEMDAAGAIRVQMPALSPKKNWEITGRWEKVDVLYKIDTSHGESALCPTHEEIITPLVQHYLTSYKDFPVCLYQFQYKFRNEPRAKSGLLRCREFLMKDAYSFHTNEADFEDFYAKMTLAYQNIFARLGIGEKTLLVKASGGAFSDFSHEFQTLSPVGEDEIYINDETGEVFNKEIAKATADMKNFETETEKPLEKRAVSRPNDISGTAKVLNLPEWQILKHVVFKDSENELIMAVIRGDLDVNPVLLELLHGKSLKPAIDADLAAKKLVKGFISTVKSDFGAKNIKIYKDLSLKTVKNWNTGANEPDFDYFNANLADLEEGEHVFWGNFAFPGEKSLNMSGKPYKIEKAVEVGNIFPLGSKFSDAFGFEFVNEDGKSEKVTMGCYGIGVSRLIGVLAELFADEKGLKWHKNIAPAEIHVISLGKSDQPHEKAQKMYENLQKEGKKVLWDDRRDKKATFGAKMKDAELIGCPEIRIISEKTLEKGGYEVINRWTGEKSLEKL